MSSFDKEITCPACGNIHAFGCYWNTSEISERCDVCGWHHSKLWPDDIPMPFRVPKDLKEFLETEYDSRYAGRFVYAAPDDRFAGSPLTVFEIDSGYFVKRQNLIDDPNVTVLLYETKNKYNQKVIIMGSEDYEFAFEKLRNEYRLKCNGGKSV